MNLVKPTTLPHDQGGRKIQSQKTKDATQGQKLTETPIPAQKNKKKIK